MKTLNAFLLRKRDKKIKKIFFASFIENKNLRQKKVPTETTSFISFLKQENKNDEKNTFVKK